MFLATRDRNVRQNLSFRRFVRAHAKPPLPGASLKLTQLKSRWTRLRHFGSSTLARKHTRFHIISYTIRFPTGPEIIGVVWARPIDYH